MITSGQVTVGTATPVQIDGSYVGASKLIVHNNDNTKVLYLGGSDVTVSTGLQLLKQETIHIDMYPTEALYAISDSGAHTVSWLRQTS